MHIKYIIIYDIFLLIFFTTVITSISYAGLINSKSTCSRANMSVSNNNHSDEEDFIDRVTFFYENKTSYNFVELQHDYILLADTLNNIDSNFNLKFSIAIIAIEKTYNWPIIKEIMNTQLGVFINKIKDNNGNYQDILNNILMGEVVQLDIWWMLFFMTGDDAFLESIFAVASSNDRKKYLYTNAAKWSMQRNAEKHAPVKEFLNKKELLTTK